MSTLRSAANGDAQTDRGRNAELDAFLAPLQELKFFERSKVAAQPRGVVRPHTVTGGGRRQTTRAKRALEPQAGLLDWLWGKPKPPAEPAAPTATAPEPEPSPDKLDMVREFDEEAITKLMRAIGGLDAADPAKLREQVQLLKRPFGVHVVEEPIHEVSQGREDAFHRVTFKMVRVKPGADGIATLDLSGTIANLSLRFENCEFDVLDLSFARLHSVDIRGCRPSEASSYFRYGFLAFARALELNNELIMAAGNTKNRVVALYAHGMKAKEIQLFGSEFRGGEIAAEIWRLLIQEVERRLLWKNIPEDIDDLVAVYLRAARRYLRTIYLAGVRADTLFLAVNSVGIADLHDARIELRLLVEAGRAGSYRRVRFAEIARPLLDVKFSGWKGAYKRADSPEDDLTGMHRLAWRLAEASDDLGGRLSPCIDLGGLECKGELRFDGLGKTEKQRKRDLERELEPPVVGFVNLGNARCHVFTDDDEWARSSAGLDVKYPLRFDLNCFWYDCFGRSPRLIVDDDAESKRSDFFSRSSRTDAVGDAIAIETERLEQEGDNFGVGSWALTVKHEDGYVPDKLSWLELSGTGLRGLLPRRPNEVSDFDAQPWTHCAHVMRQAGWHEQAEEILFEREKRVRWLAQGRGMPALLERLATVFLGLSGCALAVAWALLRIPSQPVSFAALALGLAIGAAYLSSFVPEMPRVTAMWSELKRFVKWWVPLVGVFVSIALIYDCGTKFEFLKPSDKWPVLAWESVCPAPGSRSDGTALWVLAIVTAAVGLFGVISGLLAKLGHGLLQLTIGFGYKPVRAIVQSLAIILVGALVYSAHFSPTGGEKLEGNDALDMMREPSRNSLLDSADPQRRAQQSVSGERVYIHASGNQEAFMGVGGRSQDEAEVPKPYPRFNALMYSVDVFIPVIDFSQGTYWVPGHEKYGRYDDPKGDDLWWLWAFYWFQIAAGWWYSSVLVAKFTGFLERKE